MGIRKEARAFLTEYPDLVKEWNYEKNEPISPDNVSAGSNDRVWWKCEKNHEWQASPKHRRLGTGCPYCANRSVWKGFNDLATVRPDLLAEWDYSKNDIRPDEVLAGTITKVWWICPRKHSYDMSLSIKTRANCGCPVCNGKRVITGENDFATLFPVIALEWDYKKNGELLPNQVTIKSHKMVWWKCRNCQFEWKAPIARRSSGGGCPICGKKKAAEKRKTASFHESVAYNHPDLLKEWNYDKNLNIDPKETYDNSNQVVWWKCATCDYEWKTSVTNRAGNNPTGCPACSNKTVWRGHNDLATLCPEIAGEWDTKKNGFAPEDVVSGSNKKVWWLCSRGHSYKEVVAARTSDKKHGCPYCSGRRVLKGFNDLATVSPEIAKEWSSKNMIAPSEVTQFSNKKVLWTCKKCGFEWSTSVSSRSRTGCPLCVNRVIIPGKNDFASEHPELVKEWSSLNTIEPFSVASKTGKHVWWECQKCGHVWKATVVSRVSNGSGCPECAYRLQTSMPEQIIYQCLKNYFPVVVNRYKTDWLGKSEVDIFIPDIKCGIEYDGARWHPDARKDIRKSELLHAHGINLIRVREEECPELNTHDTIISVNKYNQDVDSLRPTLQELITCINSKFDTNFGFLSDVEWEAFKREFVFDPIGESLAERNPELAQDWDFEKNGKLKPENVSVNSSRKVWWKCSKCGYSYRSVVTSRSHGTGCPACHNKVVNKGHNDLETLFPALAKEWDYSKNTKIPNEVVAHSREKAWWICSICGYEWQTAIAYRTSSRSGTGCPACAHQAVRKGITDLESLYPDIAKEWDYEKNDLKPSDVLAHSNKKYWWICSRGHSYDMSVRDKTDNGSKCPFCGSKRILSGFNDLDTLFPEIAGEWDTERNGSLTPDLVFPKSCKKRWWMCSQGHSYAASPNSRVLKKSGCPYCKKEK